jgi:hypothetical protein
MTADTLLLKHAAAAATSAPRAETRTTVLPGCAGGRCRHFVWLVSGLLLVRDLLLLLLLLLPLLQQLLPRVG